MSDAFDRGWLWACGDDPFAHLDEYTPGTLDRFEYLAGVAEFEANLQECEP